MQLWWVRFYARITNYSGFASIIAAVPDKRLESSLWIFTAILQPVV